VQRGKVRGLVDFIDPHTVSLAVLVYILARDHKRLINCCRSLIDRV
jgi:hypothetical protein